MLPDDWVAFCKSRLDKLIPHRTERCRSLLRSLVARAFYVATLRFEGNISLYNFELATKCEHNFAADFDARAILKAAADHEECDAPRNMVRYGNVPVVDYSVLNCFVQKLRFHGAGHLEDVIRGDRLTIGRLSRVCAFKEFAFAVLEAFAGFFYHWQPDEKYVPTGPWTAQLTNWMPKGKMTLRYCKRQDQLWKGGSDFKLSPQALSEVLPKSAGETALLLCGGDAPIDFLLLKVTGVSGPAHTPVRTLTVRYAGAEYMAPPWHDVAPHVFAEKRADIKKRASTAHEKLSGLLRKHNYVLSEFDEANHVLMVTNMTLQEPRVDTDAMQRPAGEQSAPKAAPDSLKGVMNPQTTKWLPLTLPLFTVDWRNRVRAKTAKKASAKKVSDKKASAAAKAKVTKKRAGATKATAAAKRARVEEDTLSCTRSARQPPACS